MFPEEIIENCQVLDFYNMPGLNDGNIFGQC